MWEERKMNTKCACGARGDAKLKVKRGLCALRSDDNRA